MIKIISQQGQQLEMTFEENDDDGAVIIITVRDWETGDDVAEFIYEGTLEEFKAEVADL